MYIEHTIMRKDLYEAPSTNVMYVKSEGIICQSGRGGLGSPNRYTPGNDPLADE